MPHPIRTNLSHFKRCFDQGPLHGYELQGPGSPAEEAEDQYVDKRFETFTLDNLKELLKSFGYVTPLEAGSLLPIIVYTALCNPTDTDLPRLLRHVDPGQGNEWREYFGRGVAKACLASADEVEAQELLLSGLSDLIALYAHADEEGTTVRALGACKQMVFNRSL